MGYWSVCECVIRDTYLAFGFASSPETCDIFSVLFCSWTKSCEYNNTYKTAYIVMMLNESPSNYKSCAFKLPEKESKKSLRKTFPPCPDLVLSFITSELKPSNT